MRGYTPYKITSISNVQDAPMYRDITQAIRMTRKSLNELKLCARSTL